MVKVLLSYFSRYGQSRDNQNFVDQWVLRQFKYGVLLAKLFRKIFCL